MTMLIEREKAIDAILSVDVHGDGQSQEALTHASVEVSLLPAVELMNRRGERVIVKVKTKDYE